MAFDRLSRTNFFGKNIINGILEDDLPYNQFKDFNFKRPRTSYMIKQDDVQRPDLISFKSYGKMNYWWIIMKLNKIEDIWNDLIVGEILQIPHLNDVEEFIRTSTRKKK